MSVETSISEGIAEIILDCPPVNALTSSEWLNLAINIDNLAHNNDVRVIAGGRAMILTEISVDGESMKPGKYLTL